MPESSRYGIFRIPGSSQEFSINYETHRQGNGPSSYVKSPEWMVQMDTLLASTVDGFNDYCELFGWTGSGFRQTSGHIASRLHTSATIGHSDISLLIPMDGYIPTLENYMFNGTDILKITIVRLSNIKEVKVVSQKIEFETCRIQTMQQDRDQMALVFQMQKRTNTTIVHDNLGSNTGQTVSVVDFALNTVADG